MTYSRPVLRAALACSSAAIHNAIARGTPHKVPTLPTEEDRAYFKFRVLGRVPTADELRDFVAAYEFDVETYLAGWHSQSVASCG